MNEKQKKILYIVLSVASLLILSYVLYKYWNRPILTKEQKEIVTKIEKKESLANKQIKEDIALASRI